MHTRCAIKIAIQRKEQPSAVQVIETTPRVPLLLIQHIHVPSVFLMYVARAYLLRLSFRPAKLPCCSSRVMYMYMTNTAQAT